MKKYILINEGLAEELELHQAMPGVFPSVASAFRAFKAEWPDIYKKSRRKAETGTWLFKINEKTQTFCVPVVI